MFEEQQTNPYSPPPMNEPTNASHRRWWKDIFVGIVVARFSLGEAARSREDTNLTITAVGAAVGFCLGVLIKRACDRYRGDGKTP